MPDTPPYESDSLRWVAIEVRYPPIEGLASEISSEFRRRLHDQFPIIEEQRGLNLDLGLQGGSSALQPTVRHRLLSRDRLKCVTVSRDAISLEMTDYPGWTQLRTDFKSMLAELQDVHAPDGVLRVGLRFIDEIRVPTPIEKLSDWSAWISPSLVAPYEIDGEGGSPSVANIALQFGEPPGYVTLFRAAPFLKGRTVQETGPLRVPFRTPDNAYFLLDTDASWADPNRTVPEFSPSRIADEILETLHRPCHRLYESAITDKLRIEVLNKPRPDEGEDHE